MLYNLKLCYAAKTTGKKSKKRKSGDDDKSEVEEEDSQDDTEDEEEDAVDDDAHREDRRSGNDDDDDDDDEDYDIIVKKSPKKVKPKSKLRKTSIATVLTAIQLCLTLSITISMSVGYFMVIITYNFDIASLFRTLFWMDHCPWAPLLVEYLRPHLWIFCMVGVLGFSRHYLLVQLAFSIICMATIFLRTLKQGWLGFPHFPPLPALEMLDSQEASRLNRF